MPLPANDSPALVEASPRPDAELCREVMTVHKATFLKLVRNRHEPERLADFFQDIASTYARIADQLRRETAS